MKLFNLYVSPGRVEVSGEFKTDGERIEGARSFLFCANGDQYVFRLTLDHNGEPRVSEYSEDEIEGDTVFVDDADYSEPLGNDIDNPHDMDDSMHGLY